MNLCIGPMPYVTLQSLKQKYPKAFHAHYTVDEEKQMKSTIPDGIIIHGNLGANSSSRRCAPKK